jgi:hypothetical protein
MTARKNPKANGAKRKSSTKRAPAKKAPAQKAPGKGGPAKRAPGKGGPAKRAPGRGTPVKEEAPPARGPGVPRPASATSRARGERAAPRARDAASPSAARAEAPKQPKATPRPADSVSSLDVNLGHVFALRPRVPTSFRPEAFRTAKHLLEDEVYAGIEEAARAVVEKALSLTREAGTPPGFKPGR